MAASYAGSFNSRGTPTIESRNISVAERWQPSNPATRAWSDPTHAPGAAYTYVTKADGTLLRIPFTPPRAERKARTTALITRNTARLDRSEAARLAPIIREEGQ
jgi:hypothetical protein